jgi:hypothetical protein
VVPISSITSTNLRKLTFSSLVPLLMWESLLDNPSWTPFDDMVCGLVDRLRASGYANTLEVEFRAVFVEPGEGMHHEKFLPKFKEKERVRVVEVSSGRFLEWP